MGLDTVTTCDDDPVAKRPVGQLAKKRDGLDHLIKGFMHSRDFERSNAKPGHWVSRHFSLEFRHRKLRQWCEPLWPNTADCLAKLRGEIDARVRAVVE